MQSILADFPNIADFQNKKIDDFLYILPVERFSITQKTRIQNLVVYPSGSVDIDEIFQRVFYLDEESKTRDMNKLNYLKKNTLIAFLSSSPTKYPFQSEHNLTLLNYAIDYVTPILDFIVFNYCHINNNRNIPGRVGQIETGETILLLSHFFTKVIYEKVNANVITIGRGLYVKDLTMLDGYKLFKSDINEAGYIVRQALRMYAQILESNSNTEKFVQTMMLFEFIASPDKYEKFQNIKIKIISHIAKSSHQVHEISKEFKYYSSGDNGNGLRTQIFHQGKRLEDLLDKDQIKELFRKLQRYLSLCIFDLLDNYNKKWEFIENFRKQKREEAENNKSRIVMYNNSPTIVLIDGDFLSNSIIKYQEIYSELHPEKELNVINLAIVCYEILLNTRSWEGYKIYRFLFYYAENHELPFGKVTFKEIHGKLLEIEKTEFEFYSFEFDSRDNLFTSINRVLDELNQCRKISYDRHYLCTRFEKIIFVGDNINYRNTLAQIKWKDLMDIVLIRDAHYSEMELDIAFFDVGYLVGKSLGLKYDEL